MRKKSKSGLFLFLLLAGTGCCLLASTVTGDAIPPLTIRVTNAARISNATLAEGEKLAGRILAAAGVVVTWVDCSAEPAMCSDAPKTTEFGLYVGNAKPSQSATGTLGFAVVNPKEDVRMAGVYYPAIRSMADRLKVEDSDVLGAAFVHEIGHVLGIRHAPQGVMSPRFGWRHINQAGSGQLLFSSRQAAELRSEISRWSAMAVAAKPASAAHGATGY